LITSAWGSTPRRGSLLKKNFCPKALGRDHAFTRA
jgi:hypothetical protein